MSAEHQWFRASCARVRVRVGKEFAALDADCRAPQADSGRSRWRLRTALAARIARKRVNRFAQVIPCIRVRHDQTRLRHSPPVAFAVRTVTTFPGRYRPGQRSQSATCLSRCPAGQQPRCSPGVTATRVRERPLWRYGSSNRRSVTQTPGDEVAFPTATRRVLNGRRDQWPGGIGVYLPSPSSHSSLE